MKSFIILLLFIFSKIAVFAQDQNPKPGNEPKSGFILTIDGKPYNLLEGEQLKLDKNLDHPVISVRLADFRTFDNGSLKFNYPAFYSFEFDQDYGYKNWTLNGKNYTIMIFELDAKTELDDLVGSMVKKFGKSNCRVDAVQIKLGDKMLDGKQLSITLVGQKLKINFMEIKLPDFKSRFISFQDTLTDDGKASSESGSSFDMISSTIKYF